MISEVMLYDSLIFLISIAVILFSKKIGLDKELRDRPYTFSLSILPYALIISFISAQISYTGFEPIFILLALSSLTLPISSQYIEMEKAYSLTFILGISIISFLFSMNPISIDFMMLGEIFGFAGVILVPFVILTRLLSLNYLYLAVLYSHFLDASSTKVALREGLKESRWLANLFLDVFGVYGIFLMKALVFIPITYYLIEKEYGKEMVFVLSIYGLVLAFRNYFLVLLV